MTTETIASGVAAQVAHTAQTNVINALSNPQLELETNLQPVVETR